MRRVAALAFGASALLIGGRAALAEQGDRVALRWSAPSGCPGGDKVLSEIDRLLGERGARPPKPIQATATVAQDEHGGFRVHLETQGDGEARVREVRGASCAAIADATALILALMIDPAAVAERDPAAPAPPPAPPRRPPPPAPPASPPRAPRPAPRAAAVPLSFRFAAWVGGDVGSLPGVALGLGGTAALVYGPLRFELGVAGWPDRASSLASRPAAGGDVSLVAGKSGACFLFPVARFEIAPCTAFELGRIHAAGFGVSTPSEGSALWSALHAGALATWFPIERIGLSLRLDAVFPFSRPRFVLENVGPVHQASPVAGRAAFGVELRL